GLAGDTPVGERERNPGSVRRDTGVLAQRHVPRLDPRRRRHQEPRVEIGRRLAAVGGERRPEARRYLAAEAAEGGGNREAEVVGTHAPTIKRLRKTKRPGP